MWEIHTKHWNTWSPWKGELPQTEREVRETYQTIYAELKDGEGIRLLKNGDIIDGVIIDENNYTKNHGG
jgi:hypothetical protein